MIAQEGRRGTIRCSHAECLVEGKLLKFDENEKAPQRDSSTQMLATGYLGRGGSQGRHLHYREWLRDRPFLHVCYLRWTSCAHVAFPPREPPVTSALRKH